MGQLLGYGKRSRQIRVGNSDRANIHMRCERNTGQKGEGSWFNYKEREEGRRKSMMIGRIRYGGKEGKEK
jgi:hypothetical protein